MVSVSHSLPSPSKTVLSMPGMSVQVPQQSVEKHIGLNPFAVANVQVLFQVESERMIERAH